MLGRFEITDDESRIEVKIRDSEKEQTINITQPGTYIIAEQKEYLKLEEARPEPSSSDVEMRILDAVHEIALEEDRDGVIPYSEIVKVVNSDVEDESERISNSKVGRILKNTSINTKRQRNGTVIADDAVAEKIERIQNVKYEDDNKHSCKTN